MSDESKDAAPKAAETIPSETTLNIRQAADFMGLSPQRLNRLRRRGEIPAKRAGWRDWSFRQADLMAYVERAAGVASAASPPVASAAEPSPAVSSTMADFTKLVTEMGPGRDDDDADKVSKLAQEAPIVRMANAILVNALESGASDIHIEPDRANVRIRIRIDGVMQQMMTMPKHIQWPIMNRFKVMADITPFRSLVPQLGAIPVKHGEREFNLRVSTVPGLYGESIVIHILNKTNRRGLAELGFANDAHWYLQELASSTSGLLLFAGPAGSGLTTTAFSVLNKINSVTMKICTLEDAIEYTLPGIDQAYRVPPLQITRTEGTRALLRHDPNVLFLGDIRDPESARAAVDAALSGVLVLATVSALDSIDALRRLVSLGASRDDVSQAVIGAVGQRLVPMLCKFCKEPYSVSGSDLFDEGFKPADLSEVMTIYKSVGCEKCGNRGTAGRIGLYEVLNVSPIFAESFRQDAPRSELKFAARNMTTIMADGLQTIRSGIVSVESVHRAIGRINSL